MQPRPSNDGAETATAREVERDDLVLSDAVEMTVSAKAQPARPAKLCKATRTSLPLSGSYSRTVVSAPGAPNGCSLDTTTLPFGATMRSSGLSSGSSTSRTACVRSPEKATMVSSPLPSGPMPEERNSLPSALNPKPRGKGHDRGRQDLFARALQTWRQRQDRPSVAQADIAPAVRPKRPAARVQSGDHTGVAHHRSNRVEREHAVGAVEEEQARLRFERQSARIDNPVVIAEAAERLAGVVEREQRAVPVPVRARRARDKQWHGQSIAG